MWDSNIRGVCLTLLLLLLMHRFKSVSEKWVHLSVFGAEWIQVLRFWVDGNAANAATHNLGRCHPKRSHVLSSRNALYLIFSILHAGRNYILHLNIILVLCLYVQDTWKPYKPLLVPIFSYLQMYGCCIPQPSLWGTIIHSNNVQMRIPAKLARLAGFFNVSGTVLN